MKLGRTFPTVLVALLCGVDVCFTQGSPMLSSLARDVERVESVREIKNVQRTFAQLAQFGKWNDMAELFSDNGILKWGNETATGPKAIERWLKIDAGNMDGIQPGSLDTMIAESPLVSLSFDGLSAKARWNGLRFMGDGVGQTRIQGGIYENEYVLSHGTWKISLLHYYPLYAGPYIGGWRNVGGKLPIIPYHFTPADTGLPIPPAVGEAPNTTASVQELASRINRLNGEDEVRNLQHSYGYYVDRRMWTDVVDLFIPNSTVQIHGVGTYTGAAGVRQAMERMGPEGLTQGVLNDHPMFDTIVEINSNGREATARGVAIGMIGNANTRTASWEFIVFNNHFVKENELWKMKGLDITTLITANYSTGWGNGGIAPGNSQVAPFINFKKRNSRSPKRTNDTLVELQRRLSRSAAYDGAENESAAYGYFLDDLQCDQMGAIHAANGHKESPFAGWFQTPERVARACHEVYGNATLSAMRSDISFHWRPQPVIHVSQDGRSAALRARLLQPSTSNSSAGHFNGAMYHDQMVLEDGKWKLWSITIDEFYWQSVDWVGGWSAANPRAANATNPSPNSLLTKYPPDVTLMDVGDREAGFQGGSGRFVAWPEIQRMWFSYRNPVSGREPEHYWPGCVPCQAKQGMSLTANGYQEPPTGPSTISTPSSQSVAAKIHGLRSIRRGLGKLQR